MKLNMLQTEKKIKKTQHGRACISLRIFSAEATEFISALTQVNNSNSFNKNKEILFLLKSILTVLCQKVESELVSLFQNWPQRFTYDLAIYSTTTSETAIVAQSKL